ncbi:MAG: ATP-dependent DNA helicase RecG [Candidatus Kerfeldbacteria bacterium]
MYTLRSPVSDISGVGPSTLRKLSRLGVHAVINLLSYFPIRHDDLRHVTSVVKLHSNETSVLRGRLQLITSRRGFRRRRMSITEGLFADGTGTIRIVWFNQPYLAKQYKAGDKVFLVGKITAGAYGQQMQSPLIERVSDERILAGRIVPVYRATAGLSQRQIRTLIRSVLPLAEKVTDWMPPEIRKRERLMSLPAAIREIHFPTSLIKVSQARGRLKFGELLPFILSSVIDDRRRYDERAPIVSLQTEEIKTFVTSLPFTLTNDQRRAAWEILKDLSESHPMYRLLEGDVGSGKTIVAAIALLNVGLNNLQGALLAPTDILARQHYVTLKRTIGSRMPLALLTRTQSEWTMKERATKIKILSLLKKREITLVVGTHSLLSPKVEIPNLGMVVIDEQHRFGVEQRRLLRQKGEGVIPHLLSMTATPIPRTLALTLYGNLKQSFLKSLPPGRVPISTRVVFPSDEKTIFRHIHERAANDEQSYIVCPLIEESDEFGTAAATTEFERLKSGPLSSLRLELLHGDLTSKEKQRVLAAFRNRSCDVLVTTPIIEVGVDVPNATVMVIEGAERFGLAQLHQLRGRVGRSAKPSHCFLMTESDSADVQERLLLLEKSNDGFALAEEDLRRRGPGDLLGLRQSGLPQFMMASLSDIELMKRVRSVAELILESDPALERSPLLMKKVEAIVNTIHGE